MVALPPACTIGGAPPPRPAPYRGANSLAVVPLSVPNPAAPGVTFIADGLVDAVADRIGAAVPTIDVLGRRAYRRRGPADSTSVRAVAREAGVKYVLTGSLTQSRDMVRLSVVLFDGTSGDRKWTHTFAYDSTTALAVEQTVAFDVASRIVSLSQRDKPRFMRSPTRSSAAYAAMLRGDGAVVASAWSAAMSAYRQAAQSDPNFTDAYAKRALTAASFLERGNETQNGVSVASELRMSVDRALLLDSSSVLAWVAEARARALEGRPVEVWRRAFERAISFNPRNAIALEEYGRALAQIGQRGEARAVLERAARANVSRAPALATLAELAMADYRDAEACALLNQALAADPFLASAWALRALLRVRHDDLRYAWADAETATRLGNPWLGESAAARVDLMARDTTRAKSRLSPLWRRVRSRGSIGAGDGSAVAAALLLAGQVSRALDVLEAVRPRGPWYAARLRDPSFDRVRNEPRFRALLVGRGWPPETRLGGEVGSPSKKMKPPPSNP